MNLPVRLTGMLDAHESIFGKYNGPEEVMLGTDGYTEITVIDNYATDRQSYRDRSRYRR